MVLKYTERDNQSILYCFHTLINISFSFTSMIKQIKQTIKVQKNSQEAELFAQYQQFYLQNDSNNAFGKGAINRKMIKILQVQLGIDTNQIKQWIQSYQALQTQYNRRKIFQSNLVISQRILPQTENNIRTNVNKQQFQHKYHNKQAKSQEKIKFQCAKSVNKNFRKTKFSKQFAQQQNSLEHQAAKKSNQQTTEAQISKDVVIQNYRAVFYKGEIPCLYSQQIAQNLFVKTSKKETKQQTYLPLHINPTLNTSDLKRIKQLNIYFCNLTSFRDLGTGWPALRYICVQCCPLIDLEGINGFPKIEQLYAPYNKIENISALTYLSYGIRVLDFEGNNIQEDQQIYLTLLSNRFSKEQGAGIYLQQINLNYNPIWNNQRIRNSLIKDLGSHTFSIAILQEKQQITQKYLQQLQNQQKSFNSYQNLDNLNYLILKINQAMSESHITFKDCLDLYVKANQDTHKIQQSSEIDHNIKEDIDIVRYEPQLFSQKLVQQLAIHYSNQQLNQKIAQIGEDFDTIFTHLQHFMPTKHTICSAFQNYIQKKNYKYFDNRNLKKSKSLQKSTIQFKSLNLKDTLNQTKSTFKSKILNKPTKNTIIKLQNLKKINQAKKSLISSENIEDNLLNQQIPQIGHNIEFSRLKKRTSMKETIQLEQNIGISKRKFKGLLRKNGKNQLNHADQSEGIIFPATSSSLVRKNHIFGQKIAGQKRLIQGKCYKKAQFCSTLKIIQSRQQSQNKQCDKTNGFFSSNKMRPLPSLNKKESKIMILSRTQSIKLQKTEFRCN